MIPEDEEYCSAECAGHSKTKEKGQKKKIFGFVIVYVIAITIFIVIAFL
jgi:predicted nucleic acid-binding Zn ribbon protein